MEYREYPPGDRAAAMLECLWTLEGHASALAGSPQPVLPDGRPEIVLHFGDRFERLHMGRTDPQPPLIFAGQLTEQLTLVPTGRIAVLGIRFRPEGAPALLRQPLHELTGMITDLPSVAPQVHAALRRVRESATSLDDAVRRARAALTAAADASRIDPRVRHAVQAIHARRGRVSIDEVVRGACTTSRQLERLFNDAVGISPKRLARIARFQHALEWLDRAETPGRGALAAVESGYSDQAHFIRDFKSLAGCPPGAHLLRRTELTEFFRSRSRR